MMYYCGTNTDKVMTSLQLIVLVEMKKKTHD